MVEIDTTQTMRRWPGVNRTGQRLPPYSLVLMGAEDANGVRELLLPADGSLTKCFVTGDIATPPNAVCDVTWETLHAAYDTQDGTPTVGQEWGPIGGSPLLRINQPGFLVTGTVSDGTASVVRLAAAGAVTSKSFRLTTQPYDIACLESGEFSMKFLHQVESGANIAVSGTVFDKSGTPTSGVDVYGSTQAINAARTMTVIGTTDGDGKYSGTIRPYVDLDLTGIPRIYVEVAASSKAEDYDPGPFKQVVSNANSLVVNFQKTS